MTVLCLGSAFLKWKDQLLNSSYFGSSTGGTAMETLWSGSKFLTYLNIVFTDEILENEAVT